MHCELGYRHRSDSDDVSEDLISSDCLIPAVKRSIAPRPQQRASALRKISSNLLILTAQQLFHAKIFVLVFGKSTENQAHSLRTLNRDVTRNGFQAVAVPAQSGVVADY